MGCRLAGLTFLSFPMANPAHGMIRLAQDVAMGGLALGIAFARSGRWSIDHALDWYPEARPDRRNWCMGVIRLALLYAFVMALLFPLGVSLNSLSETLPWFVVLGVVLLLLHPRATRISCGFIAISECSVPVRHICWPDPITCL